ncbi:MAG: hypothetical protein ACRCV0_01285 [Brevinema sp.]
MKYILMIILLVMTSCAIQGEKFRLQTRMNHWNTLLNDQELQLFAQNNTNELGHMLDQKEQETEFADRLRQIRINEAIMSFNGVQTAHFFYNTLLKDLVKFSYAEFMSSLTPQNQLFFMYQTNYPADSFASSSKIIDQAIKIYGMKGFTKEQVVTYYRTISMPQVIYPLVYDVLAFFAKYQMFEPLLMGDIDQSIIIFDMLQNAIKSTRISLRKQAEQDIKFWNNIKKRSLMTVSDKEFLEVISMVILPEMDVDVRTKTIENIRARFKEQQ